MKRSIIAVFILLVTTALCAGPLGATQQDIITLTMIAEQRITVVNDKGEEEIKTVPAAKVFPGEEIGYTVYYVNTGEERADDVAINTPVPEHMVYTEDSAEGQGSAVMFSVDKGKTYHFPGQLTVVSADGKEREARAADYTHIRWVLQKPLEPGSSGSVTFRARLK